MSDTTSTASTYLRPIQTKVGPGPIMIGGNYTGTVSASHCIKLGKIPAGAVICDWGLGVEGPGGNFILRLRRPSGTSSSTVIGLETLSASGVAQMWSANAFDQYMSTVSVSDDCTRRYYEVEFFAGTAGLSGTGQWRLQYICNR